MPPNFFGGAEVNDQGLAVADMEVAVGLGRETGVYLHPGAAAALGDVLLNELVNKVLTLHSLTLGTAGGGFDLFRHCGTLLSGIKRETQRADRCDGCLIYLFYTSRSIKCKVFLPFRTFSGEKSGREGREGRNFVIKSQKTRGKWDGAGANLEWGPERPCPFGGKKV